MVLLFNMHMCVLLLDNKININNISKCKNGVLTLASHLKKTQSYPNRIIRFFSIIFCQFHLGNGA